MVKTITQLELDLSRSSKVVVIKDEIENVKGAINVKELMEILGHKIDENIMNNQKTTNTEKLIFISENTGISVKDLLQLINIINQATPFMFIGDFRLFIKKIFKTELFKLASIFIKRIIKFKENNLEKVSSEYIMKIQWENDEFELMPILIFSFELGYDKGDVFYRIEPIQENFFKKFYKLMKKFKEGNLNDVFLKKIK